METQGTEKTFDHNKASVSDKIRLVSELEHIRAHALRAAASSWREDDDSDSVRYLILAKRAQTLRREYMKNHFGEIKDTDLSSQFSNIPSQFHKLKEIDDFVDEIWGQALDMDLSECIACKGDRGVIQ